MNRKKTLIIIGAGGHGKVLSDIAFQMDKWEEICFLDDSSNETTCLGFKIIGTSQDIEKYVETADFIIGIGDNQVRENIYYQLKDLNASIATLIHPQAIIGLGVTIDEGTVIMPGVVINVSTKIGRGVIINTSSSVDHDCIISDFVHLSPGVNVAGNIVIGQKSWIGLGSSIINNLSINADVTVGAGSLVIKDIRQKGLYFGIPSTKINKK